MDSFVFLASLQFWIVGLNAAAAIRWQSKKRRVAAWLLSPLVVGIVQFGYWLVFGAPGEEQGWAYIGFMVTLASGLVLGPLGLLAGHLLRR